MSRRAGEAALVQADRGRKAAGEARASQVKERRVRRRAQGEVVEDVGVDDAVVVVVSAGALVVVVDDGDALVPG